MTARVFFAIWPDDSCAQRLNEIAVRLAADCGGRATKPSTLHLTLAFIGDIGEDKLADLMATASQVQEESGRLETAPWTLNRLSYWPHNRIVWAGSDCLPPAIETLADGLAKHLRRKGYALPVRPFAPHVTLVRKVERAPQRDALDDLGISLRPWFYEHFGLLRSRPSAAGADYETLGAWVV